MELQEAKELLPFYVNGTLAPPEREFIEQLLKTSPELRDDLRFWQNASSAIRSSEAPVRAGHISGRKVVDFVMGTLAAGERESAERHLQTCPQCSEEYSLVKASLSRQPATPTVGERIMSVVRSTKLVYTVPALAAMIAAVIMYVGNKDEGTQDVQPPRQTPPAAMPPYAQGVDDAVSLFLTYQPQMRSAEKKTIPRLMLGEAKRVRVFVAVPHNRVRGIRYNILVEPQDGKRFELPETVQRFASSTAYDSLHFTLDRSLLAPDAGILNIIVSEILPPSLKELTPEEYRFVVTLVRTNGR